MFEPEQRLGPSAEMVMIDRMFIQEEKVALSQDRILAKERPGNPPLSVVLDQCFQHIDFTWVGCQCILYEK